MGGPLIPYPVDPWRFREGLDEFMVLQAPNPVWHILDHEYHQRLNTHGMVLDRNAGIEYVDTMIYTIEKL